MSSNNRRIQRVPALLIAEDEDEMKKKKNDYYPKVVSIGPHHRGKPELAQVEAFKPKAVALFVRGAEEMEFFYHRVLGMIGEVRNSYEEESVANLSDEDLAQMMVQDACLIITEMEIYLEHEETYHKRKAMIDHFGRLTGAVLFRDFILVENQIPLCVIQMLIESRHGVEQERKMINNYVNKCIFGEIRPIVESSRVPLHLLEFMHIILVYDCVQPREPPTLEPPKPPSKPLEPPKPRKPPTNLEPSTETSNRSIKEGCSGKSGGAPEVRKAPNPLTLVPLKPPTETSNRSIEEGCGGKSGGAPPAPSPPNHTLTLRPLKPPTETSNRAIEEGCGGKSGGAPPAPRPPNHTLTLRPRKPATETSNRANQESSRGLYSTGGIELMAPNHTKMLGSPRHAIETSNKAKKVTHSFRKVMELKARGIHFRPSATQSLLDVKFNSGFFHATLQLPEMFVSHYSKPFFKNLVAYELLPGVETEPRVTSYINLMQSLVERPEDLEELRERKIVYNQLGSDEEALNVFKDINTHGASDDGLYFQVRENIQAHYNNRIKTWIAELIHTHFRSPWTFIAFLAAAAIIALTAAQLYYDVHPVADKTPTSS